MHSTKSHLVGLKKVFLVIFICSFAVTTILSEKSYEKQIREYLEASHEMNNFIGAVLIAKDGKVIFKNGYGYANIELGVLNTPAMKFQIGSITKQFTATAIMQLYEKGLLDLDLSITKYLPDYPEQTGDKVTLHHLLTHTSGIPSYTSNTELMERRAVKISLDDLISSFKDLPLEFEPGEQFKYCNSGYIVLGAIIEATSGQPYDVYIQENIFKTIGMENSGFCHRDIILQNRVSGYYEDENENFTNADFVHMSAPFSAGGLYSTVEDMLIWDQALYSEKLLNKSNLDLMFTPFLNDYAYGWGVRDVNGRKLIRHGGGIDGFITQFDRWVDDKFCIVVFSNNINAPANQIAMELAAILFEEPYDIPTNKIPVDIDLSFYQDYPGVYEIEKDEYRSVTVENNKIYSQHGERDRIEIFPEAEDKFFF